MSEPVFLPKNYSVSVLNLVSTSDDSPEGLPCHWRSHILNAFFSNWLNKTLRVYIALGWTNEQVHHFVPGDTFPAFLHLDIQGEKVTIRSPRKPRVVGQGLCLLIQGDFIDEVELHIQLDEGAILRDDVEILLCRWQWSSSDSIFILGLHVHKTILVNGENSASLCNTQDLIHLNQKLSKQNLRKRELLKLFSLLLNPQRILFGIVFQNYEFMFMIYQH